MYMYTYIAKPTFSEAKTPVSWVPVYLLVWYTTSASPLKFFVSKMPCKIAFTATKLSRNMKINWFCLIHVKLNLFDLSIPWQSPPSHMLSQRILCNSFSLRSGLSKKVP